MKTARFRPLYVPAILAVLLVVSSATPVVAADKSPSEKWEKEILLFEAAERVERRQEPLSVSHPKGDQP